MAQAWNAWFSNKINDRHLGDIWDISCENALHWDQQDIIIDRFILVEYRFGAVRQHVFARKETDLIQSVIYKQNKQTLMKMQYQAKPDPRATP